MRRTEVTPRKRRRLGMSAATRGRLQPRSEEAVGGMEEEAGESQLKEGRLHGTDPVAIPRRNSFQRPRSALVSRYRLQGKSRR